MSTPKLVPGGRRAFGAVVRRAGGPFELTEFSLAPPVGEEVLVRVSAAGICSSDIHVRQHGGLIPFPAILGHEGAGTVEALGPDAEGLAIGDRVALSFLSCGTCRACVAGTPSYCVRAVELNFIGSRPDGSASAHDTNGPIHDHFFGQSSFATHALASRRNCVKLQGNDPLELAATLGCGVMTGAGAVLNALQVPAGASVAVCGAGAVGLSAVMAAKHVGADPIVVVDVVPARLELARDLGATATFDARTGDIAEAIVAATGGGADFTMDTAGRPEVLRAAVDGLAPRGTSATIGAFPPGVEVSIDTSDMQFRGKTLRGLVEGDADPQTFIPQVLALHHAGRFPVDRLMRTYPLAAIEQAVADSLEGRTVKPVLLMGDGDR